MNKNIIIGSLLVVLLTMGGAFALNHNGKVNTEVNFLSNSNLNNGDTIEILLKDVNGNPVSEQNIAILYESNGNTEDYHIITDSEGKAYLTLTDEPSGEHKVTVKYDGDDKYNPCTSEETIIINEGASQNKVSTRSTATTSTATASTAKYNNTQSSTQTKNNYKNKQNYKTNNTYKTNTNTNTNYNTKNNNNNYQTSNSKYDPKKEYVSNLYYDSEAGVYYDDFGTVHGGKYDGKEIVDVRSNPKTYGNK